MLVEACVSISDGRMGAQDFTSLGTTRRNLSGSL